MCLQVSMTRLALDATGFRGVGVPSKMVTQFYSETRRPVTNINISYVTGSSFLVWIGFLGLKIATIEGTKSSLSRKEKEAIYFVSLLWQTAWWQVSMRVFEPIIRIWYTNSLSPSYIQIWNLQGLYTFKYSFWVNPLPVHRTEHRTGDFPLNYMGIALQIRNTVNAWDCNWI